MDLPATATELDAVFRGKGVSGPLDWAACELVCMGIGFMEIGLHGTWTVCVLGLEPLHGRSQTACWRRGLHAGAEDCDPLGLVHVLH